MFDKKVDITKVYGMAKIAKMRQMVERVPLHSKARFESHIERKKRLLKRLQMTEQYQ